MPAMIAIEIEKCNPELKDSVNRYEQNTSRRMGESSIQDFMILVSFLLTLRLSFNRG